MENFRQAAFFLRETRSCAPPEEKTIPRFIPEARRFSLRSGHVHVPDNYFTLSGSSMFAGERRSGDDRCHGA